MFQKFRASGLIGAVLVLSLGSVTAVQAQTLLGMETLREQIQEGKKEIIAANLTLSSDEAEAFWPIYDEFQTEIEVINSRIGWLIRDFGAAYTAGTISDEDAELMLDEFMDIDADDVGMRKKFARQMRKLIPAQELVRYLQIENKIRAAIRYDLAANIPLFE